MRRTGRRAEHSRLCFAVDEPASSAHRVLRIRASRRRLRKKSTPITPASAVSTDTNACAEKERVSSHATLCWRKPDSNRRSQATASSGASGHAPPREARVGQHGLSCSASDFRIPVRVNPRLERLLGAVRDLSGGLDWSTKNSGPSGFPDQVGIFHDRQSKFPS